MTPTTKTPVMLLKTKSTPSDGYEEHFSSIQTAGGVGFEPVFVPVLEHRHNRENLDEVRRLMRNGGFSGEDVEGVKRYGGLVFTSQRAVEGFVGVIDADRETQPPLACLIKTPIYVVGPATSRTLSSIPSVSPSQILGAHTGNGEALARFILSHYTTLYPGERREEELERDNEIPPLLFLVGEQRRDIIPKILGSNKITVDELVVYETGVMESFEEDLKAVLEDTGERIAGVGGVRWAIVFSPTGCEAMLRSLHLLDPEERAQQEKMGRKTLVATIGPTTRDFLRDNFGFEPDVCAASPSAESLGDGIVRFLEKSGLGGH
ncbi:hypothetical protein FGG08_004894 [Glutinoglossum americanum]|uniref:Tetrapyrrole biosynthesis uroporphyrinogen III synthase domain-containing protein n=1 Tax=Glutinoglossum americanum TaxID=1670608 RepID=A0A9P8I444_9PEZI|nr:hypothetical protein FGG08_004894 [Glutinoglossum americanum]